MSLMRVTARKKNEPIVIENYLLGEESGDAE
jgi:hypothetical protein